jgi:hypothetical protein
MEMKTNGHLAAIQEPRAFQRFEKLAQNFVENFIGFSMTNFFNIQSFLNLSLSITKPLWCNPTQRAFQEHNQGTMTWEISM